MLGKCNGDKTFRLCASRTIPIVTREDIPHTDESSMFTRSTIDAMSCRC